MFDKLIEKIFELENEEFKIATDRIKEFIDNIPEVEFKNIVKEVGTIPESIEHDSTEEKLYSKASDIVLARCFRMLGLAAKALDERGDSADIIARSISGYNYSLVADAKCFRLSRTAKNQKDFKVSNLSDWRGAENEYAVLVAPYFQYPQITSQIYSKALDNNVCLLSWEHISILLEKNIKETSTISLESLWNASQMIARDKTLSYANAKSCFLPKMDSYVAKKIGITIEEYEEILKTYKNALVDRGMIEIIFWNNYIGEIRNYSRERAIEELIKAKKLQEKVNAIKSYINRLSK
ncbi:Type-2 restriction enzyme HindIII [uncultured Clostridium sp.]|uniref:HindIII family type II restriction endonuclease n=1 Tax=Muricoprocola aceti TaxID=2981772 RepID=A0ABT2SQA3_9FIRM|nr:HindIII family type II restriction endonuclease [Muricoprocola aceti]MCU6726661.1 HindIII family type II restriction endonuclease [Muricoprocola aceti]SCH98340.1 Type-2 restriction enzyme HindIII [uncultured Clostridium sp.]